MRHMLDDLTPEERKHAIARILASGFCRLKENKAEKRLDDIATESPYVTITESANKEVA